MCIRDSRGSQANEYLKMLKENPTEAAEMVDNDTFFSEDAPELAAGLDQTERELSLIHIFREPTRWSIRRQALISQT